MYICRFNKLHTAGWTAQMAKEYDTTSQLWFSRFPSSEEIVPAVARIRVLSALEMKTPEKQNGSIERAFFNIFHEAEAR